MSRACYWVFKNTCLWRKVARHKINFIAFGCYNNTARVEIYLIKNTLIGFNASYYFFCFKYKHIVSGF